MKPEEKQAYRHQSAIGLMMMCVGAVVVLLSESTLFLVGGALVEVVGLLRFIGGMWQQKKSRDSAVSEPAQVGPLCAAAADDATAAETKSSGEADGPAAASSEAETPAEDVGAGGDPAASNRDRAEAESDEDSAAQADAETP